MNFIKVRSPLGRKVCSNGSATMILNDENHIMGKFDGKAQDTLLSDLIFSGLDGDSDDVVLSRYIAAYWAAASAQGCPT